MKHTIYALTMFALAACTSPQEEAIDRHAPVSYTHLTLPTT